MTSGMWTQPRLTRPLYRGEVSACPMTVTMMCLRSLPRSTVVMVVAGGVGGDGGSARFGLLVDSFLVKVVPNAGSLGVRSSSPLDPPLETLETGDPPVLSLGLCAGVARFSSSFASPMPPGRTLRLGKPCVGTSTSLTFEPGVLSDVSGFSGSSLSPPGISRVLRLLI